MKFSTIVVALLFAQTSAFAPGARQLPLSSTSSCSRTSPPQHVSSLHLFGGGDKKKEGGPGGMMDQLAMFKKAQEMAQKKKKLDDELTKIDFTGSSSGATVTGTFKYVPISNPMDPNPDYEAVKFEFDDAFFAAATPTELADAVKEAIKDGIDKTNMAVAEKYQTLQADLMAAFGGGPKSE